MKNIKKILGVFVVAILFGLCLPNIVKAEETSEFACDKEFKQYLNEDYHFELKSSVPTSMSHFMIAFIWGFVDEDLQLKGVMPGDYLSPDYSDLELAIGNPNVPETYKTCRVAIDYVYDENVKNKIDELLSDEFKNKIKYIVEDLELVRYHYNVLTDLNFELPFFDFYSNELMRLLGYTNVDYEFLKLFGLDDKGYLKGYALEGLSYINYDGVLYFVSGDFLEAEYKPNSIEANPFFYVPTETENTVDAITSAAQKRVDDFMGKSKIEVGNCRTAKELLRVEANISTYDNFEEVFENEFEVAGVSEDDLVCDFNLVMPENNEEENNSSNDENRFSAIIRRDSSKMIIPTTKTIDLLTGIEINTDAKIALDAKIKVSELTGNEHEKIISLLDLSDGVSYDINLYSNSLKTYITTLEDGTFEVKIPIPKKLLGKDLRAYYVKEDGRIEEYDVTIKDGYAIFKTTHFSIYTLGYKEKVINNEETNKPNDETPVIDNNIINKEENPKTFDNIGTSLLIGFISLIGLVGATIYFKKRSNIKIKK